MKNVKLKYLLCSALILTLSLGFVLFFHGGNKNNEYEDYTPEYISYLKLTDEEKKDVNIIPDMYPVVLSSSDKNYMSALNTYSESNSLPSYYNLRDEITLYVDNQSSMNLCWAYAGVKSLETFLSLNYGEYWNFSETYVAYSTARSYSNYEIGDGGSWFYFYGTSFDGNEMGVLSESYLSYDDVFSINRSNLDYYSFLEENANRTYNQTLQSVTIMADMSNNHIIKSHIAQNGSLYISVDSSQIQMGLNNYVVSNTKTINSDHAVSIIGWDDNFSRMNFPLNCRPSSDGAFIILNSWGTTFGNGGIYYLSYEDVHVNNRNLYGITKLESLNKNPLLFDEMTAPTSTYEKNDNMNNLFNLGDDVSLSFVLKNTMNTAPDTDIKIKKNNVDITHDFWITNTKNSNNTAVSITSNTDLNAGTYIIEFTYNNKKYNKSFVIVSGAEVSYISTYGHAKMFNTINDQTKSFSTSYQKKIVDGVSVNYLRMVVAIDIIYSEIAEINFDNEYVFTHELGDSYFEYEDFRITKQIHDLNIVTVNGYMETYKVFFISSQQNEYYYINYNLNGGINDILNPRMYDNVSPTYTLYEPTRTNYDFVGWYVNIIDESTRITELDDTISANMLLIATWTIQPDTNSLLQAVYKDDLGNIVSKENLTYGFVGIFTADFSFLDEQVFNLKWYINTVYYAQFDSMTTITVNIVVGNFHIKSEAVNETEILATKSTDYHASKKELNPKWENVSSFVYNSEKQHPQIIIDGLVGNDKYPVILKFKKHIEILDETISVGDYEVEITNLSDDRYVISSGYKTSYSILANQITIRVSNITTKFSEELLDISDTWTLEGTIYNDDIIIKMTTTAVKHVAGIYTIKANIDTNPNYEITVINGTYKILNGIILTCQLPDSETITLYIDEGQKTPTVDEIYKSKPFSFLSVNTINYANGNITYKLTEISLIPFLLTVAVFLIVIGIVFVLKLIRKNKWNK